jgi:hypothetical protein
MLGSSGTIFRLSFSVLCLGISNSTSSDFLCSWCDCDSGSVPGASNLFSGCEMGWWKECER